MLMESHWSVIQTVSVILFQSYSTVLTITWEDQKDFRLKKTSQLTYSNRFCWSSTNWKNKPCILSLSYGIIASQFVNIQLSITSYYTTFPESLRKQSFAFLVFGIGMGVIGFLKIFHTIRRQSMDTKAGFINIKVWRCRVSIPVPLAC